jgi:lysophospholipase L1-like esterase
VLFLGTNDMKYTDAVGAANGIDVLTRTVMGADVIFDVSQPIFPNGPKVLLVSPPHIDPEIKVYRPDSTVAARAMESFRFAELYKPVAEKRGAWFLDAAQIVKAAPPDCVHIDAESQQKLGKAIAEAIQEIFTA